MAPVSNGLPTIIVIRLGKSIHIEQIMMAFNITHHDVYLVIIAAWLQHIQHIYITAYAKRGIVYNSVQIESVYLRIVFLHNWHLRIVLSI